MPDGHEQTRARLVAAACLSLFVAGGIGRLALGPALTAWDEGVLERIAAARLPALTGWMGVLSAVGEGTIAIPIALLVAWWLVRRGAPLAARCYAASALSGWALNILLKLLFRRPRPAVLPHLDAAGGYSWPSGHAMLAPLVFGLGAVLLARTLGRWPARLVTASGVLLAGAIAFSRLYLAVHFPSDVIGALLAGCGWAALGVAVYSPLEPRRAF
jgi:undecaprenyl-diphosphatase